MRVARRREGAGGRCAGERESASVPPGPGRGRGGLRAGARRGLAGPRLQPGRVGGGAPRTTVGVGPGKPWGGLQRGEGGALAPPRAATGGADTSGLFACASPGRAIPTQHPGLRLLGEPLPGVPAAGSAGLAAALCCSAPRSFFGSLVNFAAGRRLGSLGAAPGEGRARIRGGWVAGGRACVCFGEVGLTPRLSAFGRLEGADSSAKRAEALPAHANPWGSRGGLQALAPGGRPGRRLPP